MTTTQYPEGVIYTGDTIIAVGDEVVTLGVTVASTAGKRTILRNDGTLSIGSTTQPESNGVILGSFYDTIVGLVNNGVLRSTGNGSHETYGVFSHSGLPVINHGTIETHSLGNSRAVGIYSYFHGGAIENSGHLVVTSDGGEAFGIWNFGLNEVISNSGTILVRGGLSPFGDPIGVVGIRSGQSSGVRIENNGLIDVGTTNSHQATVGIDLYPDSSNIHSYATITNSGQIIADTAVSFVQGHQTALYMTNAGHITGNLILDHNFNAINNASSGVWTGNLQFGLDDDVLLNAGTITGAVDLGGGDDIYDGRAGSVSQTVHADGGLDMLLGGGASDHLDGGEGDDFIVGGGGGDFLTGGAGANVFLYRATSDSTVAAPDVITDFVSGVDRLDFSALAPTSVTLSTQNGYTLVTAATAMGTVAVHVSGTIAASDVLLTPHGPLMSGTSGADLVYGGDAPSALNGLAGDDLLIGGAGNDALNGGTGADRLYGGDGDDQYFTDDPYDRIYEVAGGGHDTVHSTVAFTLLGDNVEDLYMMEGAVEGAGNDGNNLIVGNALDNSLWGRGGVDQLYGGSGDDSYYVDRQDDLVFEDAFGGIDTVYATSSFYLYDNVENLILTHDSPTFLTSYVSNAAADSFGVGNTLDNVITGNLGNNLLLGGAGDDVLRGDQGNDTMYGEVGNDTLYGNDGIDYLSGGDGNDVIWGGNGADALYGGNGDDQLYGHREYIRDAISGGDFPQTDFATDILVGGAGNDILHGNSGLGDYDLMDGGSGDDIYFVDTPADLTFEAAAGGTDTVYADIAGAGYYLYANVEDLVLLGNTPFGVGNELYNHLTGNAIGNYLLGGAGDDILNGKGGNDVLFGEAGADTFVFEHGTGGDVIADFIVGIDRIDLSAIGFTSFAQVQAAMGQNGNDSFINLGGGDLVVLNGIAMNSLHAGDFLLADAAGASTSAAPSAAIDADADATPLAAFDNALQLSPQAPPPGAWAVGVVHLDALQIPWHETLATPIDSMEMSL